MFHGNHQNPRFIKTGSWITGFTAVYFKRFSDPIFQVCIILWDAAKYGFVPFLTNNFLAFFKAKFPMHFYSKSSYRSLPNFWDELQKVFEKIKKVLSHGNNLIMKIFGKLERKKAEIPEETYAWCTWQHGDFTWSFVCKYHLPLCGRIFSEVSYKDIQK